MTNDLFEYDVALSFASADQTVAEELAGMLLDRGLQVFRDEYTGSEPWSRDVLDHLVNLFARKAHTCVVLVSEGYPLKSWTRAERTSVQERALRDANKYILPVLLDDHLVPGIDESTETKDLRRDSVEQVADWIQQKLAATNSQARPPSPSHDLRSGNVSSS